MYLEPLYSITGAVGSGVKPESLAESCTKYAYCKVVECNLNFFFKKTTPPTS